MDEATPKHRGDYSLISEAYPHVPYIDYMSQGVARYWTQEPRKIIEVLVGGPIRVVGVASQQPTNDR